jgi:predicted unusual protein kinase regulating ubiquinone biosynthesis (AarF/ABC1/UbiB family)
MAAAFGCPADEVFSYISPRPVAAASLGQVYRAQLRPQYGGGEVAVKVQRPGVLEQVRHASEACQFLSSIHTCATTLYLLLSLSTPPLC